MGTSGERNFGRNITPSPSSGPLPAALGEGGKKQAFLEYNSILYQYVGEFCQGGGCPPLN